MDIISKFVETGVAAINLKSASSIPYIIASFTATCFSALAAFVPILDERKAEIEKIQRKTFVYDDKRRTRNEVRDRSNLMSFS